MLTMIAVGLAVLSLCIGNPALSPAGVVRALLADDDSLAVIAVTQIRGPRVTLAILVAVGLSLCGLLVQDVLRNDLAGPELLGTSSGAALAMTLLTLLAIPLPWAAYPLVALLGAALGGALVVLAVGRRSSPMALTVIGASVSAMLAALLTAVIGLGGGSGRLNLLLMYLLGSLSNRTWSYVPYVAVPLLVLVGTLLPLARRAEVVQLGDHTARALGIDVYRTRIAVMLISGIVAAGVTAACGPIAFVALLAPHLARAICNESRTRALLAPTAALGVCLLLSADVLSRWWAFPGEMPVGIMTTVIGVPAMLALVMRRTPRSRTA